MRVVYLDASECPECGSKRIGFNEKRGEFFCRKCGFVLMENIPVIQSRYGKVKKVFVNKEKKKIAVVIKGILKSNFEKKMKPFYIEIKKFHLPKHVEAEIITLAKKAVKKKLTMSYSKTEILSALIYYISKRENIPVMIKDLEKTYGTKKKRILRCYKLLIKELNLKKDFTVNIENYIIRIANDLNKNGKLATKAIEISEKVKINHPNLKAAVSIWIAAQELNIKIKKKDLAKFSGVSKAALRKRIKQL